MSAARRWLAATLISSCIGCAHLRQRTADPAPAALMGAFEDDYGIRYAIDAKGWHQATRTTYEVAAWHVKEQYLIARNSVGNPSAPARWTRIDWMSLDGMAPYSWAYCLSAYEAPSRDSAKATRIAQRSRPRTGCNGFPFSRMKPIATP